MSLNLIQKVSINDKSFRRHLCIPNNLKTGIMQDSGTTSKKLSSKMISTTNQKLIKTKYSIIYLLYSIFISTIFILHSITKIKNSKQKLLRYSHKTNYQNFHLQSIQHEYQHATASRIPAKYLENYNSKYQLLKIKQ